uniref:Uncharacterized protein n=1 Tax=Candidatus Kentrum sp. DK TaxID=2126562 RepID=A0A450RTR0_9GAMM|nr:MAG: hypothetical protein BECKDK2373C_GA0170839_100130 [Candidatus Kentron sp. DK]
MNSLESELLTAAREGRLLDYIDEQWRAERDDRDPLSEELARFHNEGKIDVVAAFGKLKNEKGSLDFFLTGHIFEKILPRIDAPILEVMECVLHLYREAGDDLAAGSIFTPYTDFCAASTDRPKEAIRLVDTLGDKLAGLLTPSLVAGSRLDAEQYLDEAIRLSAHRDAVIKKEALFSLGRLEYPEEGDLPEKALTRLEQAMEEESEDSPLANIIDSAFGLYKKRESLGTRVTGLIDTALAKGGDFSLYAASRILFLGKKEIPEPLLDKLLLHLRRVNPSHKGILMYIDYGLEKLLAGKDWEKAIRFIEALLSAHAEPLSIKALDGVIRELFKNRGGLLNRVMTRWFLRGESVLCEAIYDVVSHGGLRNDLILAVDGDELHPANPDQILFLARKAIGYLFIRPVTAASIVLSLLEYVEDEKTKEKLTKLLFDPLLINYPGKVADYLKGQVESETEAVQEVCKAALASLDQYMDDMKSARNIPELHPSQSQREAYHRHHSKQMSEIMRQGEEKSVLLPLVSKSVLLYGRRSVIYAGKSGDETSRRHIPLQKHSVSFEIPRLSHIDPFDMNYMLRVFQTEEIKA